MATSEPAIDQSTRPQIPIGVDLSIGDACAIASGNALPHIAPEVGQRIAEAHERMRDCMLERRLVYGVTSGFGPLANRIVRPEHIETLQRNLVYHLATGVGDVADWQTARMVVLARLSSIAQGVSGASPDLVDRMMRLLSGPYAPRIPLKGTVGASGDLTPLSHLGLALMGEGGFLDKDGREVPTDRVLPDLGGPMTTANRDALALVNGTSVMTAVAVWNAAHAARLVAMAELLTVGYAELLQGHTEAWHPAFARHRNHPGQAETTRRLSDLSDGAERLSRGLAAERRLVQNEAVVVTDQPLQDPYTIRCAPQVIGAVRDMLTTHADIVHRELNSATDNPLFPDDAAALHGGNFMGQHIAFASDALSNALLALAAFAERQVARLTDERLNRGLPAFLHQGPGGLNSGFMGAQVTATAILAEMRTRAVPASVQSLSTNAANQDFVSMGTIAARNTREHARDLSRILAILALAVAQGVDCVGGADAFSDATRKLHNEIRAFSPVVSVDRPLAPDIERTADHIMSGDLLSVET